MSNSLVEALDQAAEAAERFVTDYCILVDGGDPHSLAKRYLPDARVSWNGNALSGSEAVRAHWTAMPRCRTELQSYDCHPVPGTSQHGAPPSLLLTMTGLQSHYDPTSPNELLAKPTPQLPPGKIIKKLTPEEADQLPRQFAQTLLLVPARDPQGAVLAPTPSAVAGGIPHFTYLIASDSFRFVG